MSLSFAAVEVPRVRLARDIKVDGREAPNPSRDREGAHACHGVSQRSLTVAASMRRPLPVKRKIRGFQGACPLAEYEAAPHARVARRPPRTTRPTARLAEGPLSLISVASSERRGFVKGAPLLRGLRTLDKFPPFWNLDPEGKGAGGLRGLAPWRSMRQRLMRA